MALKEEIKLKFTELSDLLDKLLVAKQQQPDTVVDDKSLHYKEDEVIVKIPGITNNYTPLVTPSTAATKFKTVVVQDNTDEIQSIVSAPLVALGIHKPAKEYEWMEWWISVDSDDTRYLIATRFIGSWLTRTVIPRLSGINDKVQQLILSYVDLPSSDPSCLNLVMSWNILVSVIGTKAQVSSAALTTVCRILDRAVSHGYLAPRLAQTRVNQIKDERGKRQGWSEYLQIVCSVPDRIANKVDVGSIPQLLQPQRYFSQLSQDILSTLSDDFEKKETAVELIEKLCMVGQAKYLCMEWTVALVSQVGDSKQLTSVLAQLPPSVRSQMVGGIVTQLDDTASQLDNYLLVQIIGWILYSLLDANISTRETVTCLLTQQTTGMVRQWKSDTMVEAIALSVQLLAGKTSIQADIQFPSFCTFDYLLKDSLSQVILPIWSTPELVTRGRIELVQPLTRLILMLVPSLETQECQDLSMSMEFTSAIPRFLSASVTLVRLSGILVADLIVGSIKDTERVDFGLDDIIRDAERLPNDPVVGASARYIKKMRGYQRPLQEIWQNQSTNSAREPTKYIREYNGLVILDDDKVLAPRQTSLTQEAELQSQFVKPRTPVFLTDCLTYLKTSGTEGMERVQIGLFALPTCIKKATLKSLEELWLPLANKLMYVYNKGPEDMDMEWDQKRRQALVGMAIRLPEQVGPFLAARTSDRNMTQRDTAIALAVISQTCMELSGTTSPDSQREVKATESVGMVVRRSRKLDLVTVKKDERTAEQKRYASIVGRAFFSPLLAEYEKVTQLEGIERLVDTLGVILYTSASSPHVLSMSRGFWELAQQIRTTKTAESPALLDSLLFGIECTLRPEIAVSVPTLAHEFRQDMADMLVWINQIMEHGLLGNSTMQCAVRIVKRLRDIQQDVYRRMTSEDFSMYSTIL